MRPSAAGERGAIPWRRLFRELSSAYHWTPREIGELTLAQAAVYLSAAPDARATRRGDAATMLAFSRARRRDKQEWIERQRRALRRGAS